MRTSPSPEAGEPGRRVQLECLAISPKRYALFERRDNGKIKIRKYSEHGLGHLRNPIDPESDSKSWIRELWRYLILDTLGREPDRPEWFHRPAVSRLTVSSPALHEPFGDYNAAKAYAEQVKPFGFLLAVYVMPGRKPRPRFHLIAPWEPDPSKWLSMPWIDRYSGEEYRITTAPDSVLVSRTPVKSYGDVFEEYRSRPDFKSARLDGEPADRQTVGHLRRRFVQPLHISHIGKETNRLHEVRAGIEHEPEEVRPTWGRPYNWRETVLPILGRVPRVELAERLGVTTRRLRQIFNEGHEPSEALLKRMVNLSARRLTP